MESNGPYVSIWFHLYTLREYPPKVQGDVEFVSCPLNATHIFFCSAKLRLDCFILPLALSYQNANLFWTVSYTAWVVRSGCCVLLDTSL